MTARDDDTTRRIGIARIGDDAWGSERYDAIQASLDAAKLCAIYGCDNNATGVVKGASGQRIYVCDLDSKTYADMGLRIVEIHKTGETK